MIKVFETKAEYNEFTGGGTRLESGTLYYVNENGETHFITNNIDGQMKQYDMVSAVDYYRNQYCTVEPLEDGNLALTTENVHDVFISRDDGVTWEKLQYRVNVPVKKGQNILLKGNFLNTGTVATNYGIVQLERKFNLSGNIASLSKGDNFRNGKKMTVGELRRFWAGNDTLISVKNLILDAEEAEKDAYSTLFYYCINLIDAPVILTKTAHELAFYGMFAECHKLVVPPDFSSITALEYDESTTTNSGTFWVCFQNCTSLTTAPKLPKVDILTPSCYHGMFDGCSSLTTAPELPAATLSDSCYYGMFRGCTSLTTAPELPATTLANSCYRNMFKGCTSLTQAPELPATDVPYRAYREMFLNCPSLTTAPKLPATTLGQNCYREMFRGCSSLTTAPELPATELGESVYVLMFRGCTSLTKAPELPATALTNYCYQGMFYGCSNLTKAPELPATTLADFCYGSMFYGCEKLKKISAHMTENLTATDALKSWVQGVAEKGTIYLKEGVLLPEGINGIPTGWTVKKIND